MSQIFTRPLPVGKTDKYTFTEDAKWLNGAAIVNPVVTAGSGVSVGAVQTAGNVIEATLTGVTPGKVLVHYSFATDDGRTGCETGLLTVESCGAVL